MKLLYIGLDGEKYTAEWKSNPVGHLRVCKAGSRRAVMSPFMSRTQAEEFFERIKGDGAVLEIHDGSNGKEKH